MVAPILITLLLGVSDIVPTAMAKFKTSNATQAVADLATQFPEMQFSDMVNVFAGGTSVLAPFSGTGLDLRITSVVSDGNGNAFIHWSCGKGALLPKAAKSFMTTTPTGGDVKSYLYLYNDNNTNKKDGSYFDNGTNTSFVVVESQYTYTAPARFVLKTPQTMTNVAYMLPRLSSYIGFPWDGNPNNDPAVPTSATHSTSTTLSNGAVCNYVY